MCIYNIYTIKYYFLLSKTCTATCVHTSALLQCAEGGGNKHNARHRHKTCIQVLVKLTTDTGYPDSREPRKPTRLSHARIHALTIGESPAKHKGTCSKQHRMEVRM